MVAAAGCAVPQRARAPVATGALIGRAASLLQESGRARNVTVPRLIVQTANAALT